jgi:hypothetical protein
MNSLAPLQPATALGEILVRLIHPTVDASETAAVLDAVGMLVARLPVHELRFRPMAHAFRLAVEQARTAPFAVPT